jgi:A/G-specific adenine glycosylase
MQEPTKKQLIVFIKQVEAHYTKYGRHDLPWRQTTDPYAILVSEVMLQQTQALRVIPKYQAFMAKYPTPEHLAKAPLSAVLQLWIGLGYNRRAKYLHEAAKKLTIASDYPKTVTAWQALPGVGPYTAAAVCAFAYDDLVTLIETNVRTVFIHHFFADQEQISDQAIMELVEKVLPHVTSPRRWYYALMDYGSALKKEVGNLNTKSKHYTKQSRFVGSDRQVRGSIIRALASCSMTKRHLSQTMPNVSDEVLARQLGRLISEGLVLKQSQTYTIAT